MGTGGDESLSTFELDEIIKLLVPPNFQQL